MPVFPHLPLSREEVAQAWRWAEGQLSFPWAQRLVRQRPRGVGGARARTPPPPAPSPPARRRRAEVVLDDGPSRLRDLGLRYLILAGILSEVQARARARARACACVCVASPSCEAEAAAREAAAAGAAGAATAAPGAADA